MKIPPRGEGKGVGGGSVLVYLCGYRRVAPKVGGGVHSHHSQDGHRHDGCSHQEKYNSFPFFNPSLLRRREPRLRLDSEHMLWVPHTCEEGGNLSSPIRRGVGGWDLERNVRHLEMSR